MGASERERVQVIGGLCVSTRAASTIGEISFWNLEVNYIDCLNEIKQKFLVVNGKIVLILLTYIMLFDII